MSPRPTPDLTSRRDRVLTAAREIAESEGWATLTMRRLCATLGVTQPVLYTAFASRQAIIDAVALGGFSDLAAALEAADPAPLARMAAYLDFAATHPHVYEAMFLLPSGLTFAVEDIPQPLQAAFAGIRTAFPDTPDTVGDDGTRAEVAWSLLHGLATLQAGGRLTPGREQARFDLTHRLLTQQQTQQESPS
ncbi:MAG: TetR/AcrR family transcriptional regulator [Janthinobacterium lividum]